MAKLANYLIIFTGKKIHAPDPALCSEKLISHKSGILAYFPILANFWLKATTK